ncbi:MAG: hypothetical protein ABF311_09505 [Polaribacter sp.]
MIVFYNKLPVFLQNILVTLKNISVYNYKYGAIPFINPIYKIQKELLNKGFRINDSENLSKINNFLNYVTSKSFYYKKNKQEYIQIKNIEDFKNIPILKKNVLKQNIEEFYSKDISYGNYVKFKTSGTTGSPMVGFISKKDLMKRFKIILKTMCESGFDITKPYARFLGKELASSGPVFRKDYLNNHYFFSIFRLSNDTVYDYYNSIITNKIEFLEGYPSTINNLVNLLKKHNLKVDCVKRVFVTAEKLNIYQKDNIEKFFRCKVFDYYGSTEQSIYIYKPVDSQNYLCSNITGYLEVLNAKGELCNEGDCGEMVVTSFTSRFTPLVRYIIGDSCRVQKIIKNSDGSLNYELSEIIGRNEESFETMDGRIVSRFSLVLKFLPKKISAAQLFLSEKNNKVVIRYTSDYLISNNEFNEFQTRIIDFIGKGYNISFLKVETLKKNNSGKVKTVFIDKK